MIGQSIAHFEITAKIGEGGMGEVYQATDTKLGREVALKILPESFARDPQRMGRFQREAQVLASLNHPNIAAIHGLEDANGQKALVMELVEGEDLVQRIARGLIPIDEALPIALQIAEALEDAHEKGIVHRDLKPANIKLTPEGKVKVLDFGLAKALEDSPEAATDPNNSPTLTMAATQVGMILGTAGYMSPEQARGQIVDKRADIWAFGCVLFEMLTGKSTYSGKTISDVLARVLEREPEWDKLPDKTSPAIHYLLKRCLQKQTGLRLRDIGEAGIILKDPEGALPSSAPSSSEPSPSNRQWWLPLAVILLVAFIATWFLSSFIAKRGPTRQLLKTEVSVSGLFSSPSTPPIISPDGLKIFYASQGKYWIRDLRQSKARQIFPDIAGGEGYFPCWSPDSRSVAIVTPQQILRTELQTGQESVIAPRPPDLLGSGGTAWLPDDRILIVGGDDGALSVPAQGGEPKTLLPLAEDETDFHQISPLPNGRGFLLTVHRAGRGADAIAVSDGKTRSWILRAEGERFSSPAYSPSGHVLYSRSTTNPGVWAIPFAIDTFEVTGDPFLVHPEPAAPSVSTNETLVLGPFNAERNRLVWVNREGEVLESVGPERRSIPLYKLSRNDDRLLILRRGERAADVWIEDLVRGTESALVSTAEADYPGGWLSHDEVLIWVISQTEIRSLPTGDRAPKLPPTTGDNPTVSADGRYIVFERLSEGTMRDLWYIDLYERTDPVPLQQTTADEYNAALSPDGSLLAYESDESGRGEIYLMRFPDGRQSWKVSSQGGSLPRWSPTAHELFFIQGNSLFSVKITVKPNIVLGERTLLFNASVNNLHVGTTYEVASDGARFLVPQLIDDRTDVARISIIQNWFEEFRRE